jgi:hypothetical protein
VVRARGITADTIRVTVWIDAGNVGTGPGRDIEIAQVIRDPPVPDLALGVSA